jgi:hypothetical protein
MEAATEILISYNSKASNMFSQKCVLKAPRMDLRSRPAEPQDGSGIRCHYKDIRRHGSRSCSSMSSIMKELLIVSSIILKDDKEVAIAHR